MTSFVTRDVTHLGVDRIATSTTAFALYENLLAAFEKDSSAVSAGAVLANGYVTEAILASSAVSQAKLKTALNSVSSSAAHGYSVLAGGRYCFLPTAEYSQNNAADRAQALAYSVNGGTSFTPTLNTALSETASVNQNGSEIVTIWYDLQRVGGSATVRVQYVSGSPPYDLGDGPVPLFMFARVDGAGNTKAVWTAEDPPWANNGPTRVRPDGWWPSSGKAAEAIAPEKRGKPYRLVREIDPQDRAKLLDPVKRAGALQRIRAAAWVEEEITQELKQRDMALIPHPFATLEAGETVAMIPLSGVLDDLADLHGAGEDVGALVARGYVQLSATPAVRRAPPRVLAATCTWKNTP
jgi:hypothetical protein